MSKDKFFKELEKRLEVLDANEREDIINEYKDTLNEKIKHGKSEEEAIADFGNIDELVKEILSTYKINTDYMKDEDKFKKASSELGSSFNKFIKTSSEYVADMFRQINDDLKESGHELSIELVTELVIKGLITLLILAVATIPFKIIMAIGTGILTSFFFPLSTILNIIWVFLIGILYLCVAGLIIISMFKEYINYDSKKDLKREEKFKEKSNKKDVITKEKKNKVIKEKRGNGIASAIMIMVKIFVILFILLPLWCLIIGTCIGFAILVYYTIKGLPFISIDVLTLGILSLLIILTTIITNITFKKKKITFYPLIISIVLISVGSVMTFDYAMNLHYHNNLSNDELNVKKDAVVLTDINKVTNFYIYDSDFRVVEDNSLKDGEVVVELSYYSDFVKVEYHTDLTSETPYVNFFTEVKDNYTKNVYNLIIDDLKDNEVYNYDLLNQVEVTKVSANKNTKGLVK